MPETVIDGEFLEVDPPHRLVQTWRMLMDPDLAAEGFTKLTHEIESVGEGVTKLTVIHELENAPRNAHVLAGGIESRAVAAAGRGCSATSSRCWRRGRTWPRVDDRDTPAGRRTTWR